MNKIRVYTQRIRLRFDRLSQVFILSIHKRSNLSNTEITKLRSLEVDFVCKSHHMLHLIQRQGA